MFAMIRSSELGRPNLEAGAATLIVVALLSFCLALMLIYVSRIVVTQQRLAGNDVLARAGLAAAQAGLETALVELAARMPEDPVFDLDGWISFPGPSGSSGDGASYSTRVSNRGLVPFRTDLLDIEATGTPPDGAGTRIVRQLAHQQPWLPTPPPAPLVVRGSAGFAAGTVTNTYRPVAAWMGGELSASALDVDLADESVCGAQGICANDSRLAGLSPADFFETFLNRTPAIFKKSATEAVCGPCVEAAEGASVLWLEGSGGTVSLSGSFGAEDAPVIVIVNGDLRLLGATEIHGLIYVQGDWLSGPGELSIHGAMMVAGDISDPAPFQLRYEPALLEPFATTGPYARVAGSWSDF